MQQIYDEEKKLEDFLLKKINDQLFLKEQFILTMKVLDQVIEKERIILMEIEKKVAIELKNKVPFHFYRMRSFPLMSVYNDTYRYNCGLSPIKTQNDEMKQKSDVITYKDFENEGFAKTMVIRVIDRLIKQEKIRRFRHISGYVYYPGCNSKTFLQSPEKKAVVVDPHQYCYEPSLDFIFNEYTIEDLINLKNETLCTKNNVSDTLNK